MPAQSIQEPTQDISISELERAINYWRVRYPSSRETMTLCPQAASLAELYARMILFQMSHISWAEFSTQAREAFQEAQVGADSKKYKAA